jgi:S1-C subfamily serine protease
VAERAGLKVGDIITEWDGMRLADFSLQVNIIAIYYKIVV